MDDNCSPRLASPFLSQRPSLTSVREVISVQKQLSPLPWRIGRKPSTEFHSAAAERDDAECESLTN